jgi:YhcG PDDEXK nuclease domain/DUF1016 N-terminal domain
MRKLSASLRRQLGWTHFKALLPIQDDLKRSFYAEMCRVEGWSTRTLQEKIKGRLQRLVLVELKLGTFQAADYGQTQLYLRWLDRHERQPGEEPPIGLIFCAGKTDERVELLELEKTGIRVAQYLTELPPREVLQRRLHEAVVSARAPLEGGSSIAFSD